jgi:hypothetical protein
MWYSYAHAILPFSSGSPMILRFLCANARGLPEHTESRRRFGEDGVDQEETEERDVWIRRELVNKNNGKNEQKQKQKQNSTGESRIDSVDSLISACGSPMPMRFSNAHDVLLWEREAITENDPEKMVWIQNNGKRLN